MSSVVPLCINCVFYSRREKGCSRFIAGLSKTQGEILEKVDSVRLDPHRCGPEGKLYVSKASLHVFDFRDICK
jgi:hypothetical protein